MSTWSFHDPQSLGLRGVSWRRAEAQTVVDDLGAVREVGWMTGGTDLSDVLRILGEACSFPTWYGGNLDAAWDCLTDLEAPVTVVWDEWEPFAVAHPDDFAQLVRLWRDRADQAPDFAVVMVS